MQPTTAQCKPGRLPNKTHKTHVNSQASVWLIPLHRLRRHIVLRDSNDPLEQCSIAACTGLGKGRILENTIRWALLCVTGRWISSMGLPVLIFLLMFSKLGI